MPGFDLVLSASNQANNSYQSQQRQAAWLRNSNNSKIVKATLDRTCSPNVCVETNSWASSISRDGYFFSQHATGSCVVDSTLVSIGASSGDEQSIIGRIVPETIGVSTRVIIVEKRG